jgi:hypothetical protein
MVGHKTEAIYRRYRIVDQQDRREAAARIDADNEAVEAMEWLPTKPSGLHPVLARTSARNSLALLSRTGRRWVGPGLARVRRMYRPDAALGIEPPRLWHDLVEIQRITCALQLTSQSQLPTSSIIDWVIDNTENVGWQFDSSLVQDADAFTL